MENHEMVQVANPDGKTLEVLNPEEMNLQVGSELGNFDNLGEKCDGFESSLQLYSNEERHVDTHNEGFVVGHNMNVGAVEGESEHVSGEKEAVCVEENRIGCFGNEEGLFSGGNDEGRDVGDITNVESLNVADAVEGESLLGGEKEAVGVEENGIGCFMGEEGLLSRGTDEGLPVGNDINVEAYSGVDDTEGDHLHAGKRETVGVNENDTGCFRNEEGLLANEGIYKHAESVKGYVEVGSGDELNSCSGNLGEQTEVKESVEDETQEDDLLEDNGVDTSTKIEVSGHNISIYVDFSGPLSAEGEIQKKAQDLTKTFNDLDTVAENREGCFIDEKIENSDLATDSRKRKRRKYFEFVEGLDDGPITMSEVDGAGFVGSLETGEKSSEFRERKKSKYLCYPYVEGLRTETEDGKSRKISGEAETMNTVANQFAGFCPVPITSSKRFQKKWFEKFINGNVMPHNSELVNASVADLLSDLHFLAMDCWCLSETGNFDLIEWFFSQFRISAFHDESIYVTYCENVVGSNADAALGKDTQTEGPTSANVEAVLKKRKRRNPSRTKTKVNSDLSESVSDSAKDNQEKGPVMPNGKQPKKSKKLKEASHAGIPSNEMSGIPDLNGNGSTECVINHVEVKARPKKRRKTGQLQNENGNNPKTGTLSEESKSTGASSIGAIPESNTGEFTINVVPESNTGVFTVSVPNSKENSVIAGLFAKYPAATTSVLMGGKPVPRKRKRKVKSISEQTVPGSSIPDLNGTTAETGTSVKAEKKQRKKGEATSGQVQKKCTTGVADTSVNHGKRKNSRKTLGTSLFLTFAPGATLPSEEVLNTTFAKFGSLKESETKVSKELCNAQVVFWKRAGAVNARKSLLTSNPFGEALLNSRVQRILTAAAGQATTGLKAPAKLPGPLPVVGGAPPIDFIRHNLEMMKAMLEKSGDNLSPELKAKLESEIKGLLQKVSFMPSGSSS